MKEKTKCQDTLWMFHVKHYGCFMWYTMDEYTYIHIEWFQYQLLSVGFTQLALISCCSWYMWQNLHVYVYVYRIRKTNNYNRLLDFNRRNVSAMILVITKSVSHRDTFSVYLVDHSNLGICFPLLIGKSAFSLSTCHV